MAPRTILLAAAYFVAGVVMGIGSLLAGPIGVGLATVVRARQHPARAGSYLLGADLTGLAFGLPIILRMRACGVSDVEHGECYTSVTAPAADPYAASAGLGLLLISGPVVLRTVRSNDGDPLPVPPRKGEGT